MARKAWSTPLTIWAARDLLRRPALSVLLFFSLASVVTLVAVTLLLNQSLRSTCSRLMSRAPDMIVRRVGAGGWLPMPAQEAVKRAAAVAGVVRPRARIWGTLEGPGGPVTVVAAAEGFAATLPENWPYPQAGQALIGDQLVTAAADGNRITLTGRKTLSLDIIGRLPDRSSMSTHDVVVVAPEDARSLLGLEAGQASDLALDVYHEEEAAALRSELASAFGWPVRITTRREQLSRINAEISRRSGAAIAGLIPAALALILVVAAVGVRDRPLWQTGVLKAVGWTGADILKLHIYRGLLIGLPAVVSGSAAAYLLLFWPGQTWIPGLVFGWSGSAPGLYLSARGTAGTLALTALMTGLPFVAAVFWTGWRSAVAEPSDCIEGNL